MNYVELFAGAGGLSLGFEKAGFKNIFSVEYDPLIAKTYRLNFPNNKLICEDIKKITNDEIRNLVKDSKVDVIIGGPPCQGFSMAGRVGRSFIDDERNFLFKEFVRFVSVVRPKIFIMENVSRLAIHNKGKTINEIVSEFEKLGYQVQYKVLQSAEYNVPQKRQRIFVVGTRNLEFSFPAGKRNFISVSEAIGDLPKLKSGEKSNVPNHIAMNHSNQMLEKMSFIPDGGNRNSIPVEIRPKSGDSRKYIRYNSKLPSVTVTGDMRKIFHYNQNRALTNRELARLQSFPDNFVFVGNSISIQQQIGNAVPPNLSYAIAKEVRKSIDRNGAD